MMNSYIKFLLIYLLRIIFKLIVELLKYYNFMVNK